MRRTFNPMLAVILQATFMSLWRAPLAAAIDFNLGTTYRVPGHDNYSCTLPDDIYYCTPSKYSYTGTPPFIIKFYTSALRTQTPAAIDSRNFTTWYTTLRFGTGTKLWVDCSWPGVDYHVAVDTPLIVQQNTSACGLGGPESVGTASGGTEAVPEETGGSQAGSTESGSSLSTATIVAIAAGTAGGVIAIAALLGCLWFMKRKKRPTVTSISNLDLHESSSTVHLSLPTAPITPFSYELIPSPASSTPFGGTLTTEPTSMSMATSPRTSISQPTPRTSMYAKPARPTHPRMRTLSGDTALSRTTAGNTSMGQATMAHTPFTIDSMSTASSMANTSDRRKSAGTTSLGQMTPTQGADPQFPEATDPDRAVHMHHDAGRVTSDNAEMAPAEIPPAYDASWRAGG